jgi:nucleoside-diphosphate-sugar epimerase
VEIKNKKILISGASGFIGSRLVQKFLDRDAEVFSIVRDKQKANHQSKVIVADLSDANFKLPDEHFDVVYHLASLTPLEKSKKKLKHVNYQGTKNLFNAVKDKTKSLVYISGLAVFDSKSADIDENTPINPNTYFTKLRVMAQRYLEENCKGSEIDCTVAYVGDVVYGNGGFFKSDLVNRLKNGKFRIPGDGKYFKNYIHVDDVAGTLIAIFEKNKTNQSFVITGSNPAQFREFIDYLASQLGVKKPKTAPEFLVKLAIGSDLVKLLTTSTRASNKKIREIYDFQYPQYQDGIKDTIIKLQ